MNLPMKALKSILGLFWTLYRHLKKQEDELKRQEEELRQKKKKEEDAAFDEREEKKKCQTWEEKLEKAYSECSSYGKNHKTSYKRHYRRKSAH